MWSEFSPKIFISFDDRPSNISFSFAVNRNHDINPDLQRKASKQLKSKEKRTQYGNDIEF